MLREKRISSTFVAIILLFLLGADLNSQIFYRDIFTPRGTLIGDSYITPEFSASTRADWDNHFATAYPNAIQLKLWGEQFSTSGRYNCHGYAWHMIGDNAINDPVWIGYYNYGQTYKYWQDGSYSEVAVQYATHVDYTGDHSAVTTGVSDVYISKWGSGPLMNHHKNYHPGGYGTPARFLRKNPLVPQDYSTINAAVSAAVPGQTIYVSSGNYTLTSNITIPSGVTLTLLSGANVNFNGRYIDATNGVFNIQNGSTVYVTNGYSRYYGLFTSVQSAINFASSGRTVQLLSMTYPENISFSSKSNIALKGQEQGSTTLNGSISVTNSSSISVSNMTVTSPLTLNNASNTSLTNVTATGSRLANVYGGTQNQFGLVTATNIGAQEWALNIYGGTGDVYYSTISNADEVAIHLTNNASYNIGTNNMFCNNGYDIYAVGGGYAYAISNTYSRPLPSSIYGNVFITGVNYVCGGGGGGGMNAMSTTTGLQAVNHDMRTLDDTYLTLMRRMREDRENDTYDPARYSQEYRELIEGYKSLITNKSDISAIKPAILRVAQLYKAIEEENAFRTYTDNVLASGEFESLTPYFRRWELWDYVGANQYGKSLQIADEVLSSIGADDDLRAEMLYEKGLVYKYYLNDPAKSGEVFGMLIDKYPSSPLSRFAEGEMESEMYEFVQEEILEAEQLEEVLSYRLESYPNPFNPVTVIRFSLPSSGMVQLRVYDTLGRVVAVLAEGVYEAGVHEAVFDASRLPSGMYFTRLEAGGQSLIHRMLLVK